MSDKKAQHISDEEFEAMVIQSEKPVLVDFYADWCGPCKMSAPILDDLSGAQDEVTILKIDVDESPDAAQKYGVMSIPTVIAFKGGQEVDRHVGFSGRQAYVDLIEKAK